MENKIESSEVAQILLFTPRAQDNTSSSNENFERQLISLEAYRINQQEKALKKKRQQQSMLFFSPLPQSWRQYGA